MKTKLKFIIFALTLGGCIGLAVTMSILLFLSWSNKGVITLSFNQYHEQILEAFLFPVWAIGGLMVSRKLLIEWIKRGE